MPARGFPFLRLVAAALLVLPLLMSGGCESMLGKFIVRSPNHGKTLKKLDVQPPVTLPGTVIDHHLRVPIHGDMPANLAVWVIDPSNEQADALEGEQGPMFHTPLDQPRSLRPGVPRGTVLILHGYHDDMNQPRYLMWARVLAAEGYRAVLLDQRGHGQSTGDWSSYGVREARDLTEVLDYLDRQELLVPPVGAMGVSFGGATAVHLADRDPRVRALVLISTYTSMRDVVPDFGRAIGFDSYTDAKFQRIVTYAGEHAHFDPDDSDVIGKVARLDRPVLIIHGEDDYLIPIQHALRIEEAAHRDEVRLVRIAGADHTSLADQVAEPVRAPLVNWFNRYLRPTPLKTDAPVTTDSDADTRPAPASPDTSAPRGVSDTPDAPDALRITAPAAGSSPTGAPTPTPAPGSVSRSGPGESVD